MDKMKVKNLGQQNMCDSSSSNPAPLPPPRPTENRQQPQRRPSDMGKGLKPMAFPNLKPKGARTYSAQ
jgi:hypothetical protein